MESLELLEELEAFNPRWKQVYRTASDAAKAAGVSKMFQEWLLSPEGQHYREIVRDVPDYEAYNEAERRMRGDLLSRLPLGSTDSGGSEHE